MAKKKQPVKSIRNKRVSFDYDLEDSIVAGLVLSGVETKALRLGHGHLRGAFVILKDGEVWLTNATITGFQGAKLEAEDQTRSRKLLLKKREIDALATAKQQGRAVVPIELLTGGRYIKVRIATGRGKKRFDKRQTIKKRDEERAARVDIKRGKAT